MPLTLDQAIHSQEFHAGDCTCTIGKRGGRTFSIETWRRNGKTKLWKTRPADFRIPVKYGLKSCDYIDNLTTGIHAAEDCPLRNIPADYSIPGTWTGAELQFLPAEFGSIPEDTLQEWAAQENVNASD